MVAIFRFSSLTSYLQYQMVSDGQSFQPQLLLYGFCVNPAMYSLQWPKLAPFTAHTLILYFVIGSSPFMECLVRSVPSQDLSPFNFDLIERDPFNRIPFYCGGVARSAVCLDAGGYRYILVNSVLFHFCGVEFNRVTDETKKDTWNKRLVEVDIVKCDTEVRSTHLKTRDCHLLCPSRCQRCLLASCIHRLLSLDHKAFFSVETRIPRA